MANLLMLLVFFGKQDRFSAAVGAVRVGGEVSEMTRKLSCGLSVAPRCPFSARPSRLLPDKLLLQHLQLHRRFK